MTCETHRNINYSNSSPCSIGPNDQLTQPQASEEQQHARHRRRERDRDMLEEGVYAEARHEDHENAGGDEYPRL